MGSSPQGVAHCPRLEAGYGWQPPLGRQRGREKEKLHGSSVPEYCFCLHFSRILSGPELWRKFQTIFSFWLMQSINGWFQQSKYFGLDNGNRLNDWNGDWTQFLSTSGSCPIFICMLPVIISSQWWTQCHLLHKLCDNIFITCLKNAKLKNETIR